MQHLKTGDPMVDSGAVAATPGQSITDLGGPTPDNYRPTDDSAKLNTGAVKTVKDVVGILLAARAEETEVDDQVIDENSESSEEEVVSEQEVSEEETVEEEPTLQIDVEEHVNAILGDEDLSEEFKERAKTVFRGSIQI